MCLRKEHFASYSNTVPVTSARLRWPVAFTLSSLKEQADSSLTGGVTHVTSGTRMTARVLKNWRSCKGASSLFFFYPNLFSASAFRLKCLDLLIWLPLQQNVSRTIHVRPPPPPTSPAENNSPSVVVLSTKEQTRGRGEENGWIVLIDHVSSAGKHSLCKHQPAESVSLGGGYKKTQYSARTV